MNYKWIHGIRWKTLTGKTRNTRIKPCFPVTLYTKNPIVTGLDPEPSPGFRSEGPATNRQRRGTVAYTYVTCLVSFTGKHPFSGLVEFAWSSLRQVYLSFSIIKKRHQVGPVSDVTHSLGIHYGTRSFEVSARSWEDKAEIHPEEQDVKLWTGLDLCLAVVNTTMKTQAHHFLLNRVIIVHI
jgi:hypothetical protein